MDKDLYDLAEDDTKTQINRKEKINERQLFFLGEI
jgi:hypothetical protein